ncbi:MAG: hypothetical protein R3F62_31165 [Planctomycetota bacterium]
MKFSLGALVALWLCSVGGAFAQGAGTLTPVADGFTWTRGAHSFHLRNRTKDWTAAEAAKMKYALDLLPDVLFEYATNLKVTQLRRDDVPRKRFGLKSNGIATTVVDHKWISFGDLLLQRPEQQVYFTVAHEFGHVAQYGLTGKSAIFATAEIMLRGIPAWGTISWSSITLGGLRQFNGFVSNYARTNHREDFAESVEFYWINPAELLRVSPQKYQFMRTTVFKNVVSPTTSQVPTHVAIQPVLPTIQSLSKTRAGSFSIVRVRGEYFMGFKDGGRNRVEYRQKKALTLPLTRKTILTWVPSLSPGQAPVTVETPDGKSAAAPFESKKPWWKFW